MRPDQLSKLTKPVIIMPFHLNSALLCHALTEAGVQVLGFYDNDKSLEGEYYDGFIIKQPEPASELKQDAEIIIFYKAYEDDIKRQMTALGYTRFVSAQELDKTGLQSYFSALNEWDLLRLRPKYNRQLWTSGPKKTSLAGIPFEEYGRFIFSAISNENAEQTGRRILMIPHALTYVGSTIALQLAANALKRNGDQPVFLCWENGSLLPELLNDGVPVIIDSLPPRSKGFLKLAAEFDMVIVNTALSFNALAIEGLNRLKIPVFWWFHEAYQLYGDGAIKTIPPDLGEHIHIYSAGEYARDAFLSSNPKTRTKNLWWGIEDFFQGNPRDELEEETKERLKIMTVGTIQPRKGQDIFCEAIRRLEESVRAKCEFVFIGIPLAANPVYDRILALKKDYPESVTLIDNLSREELYKAVRQCDCMVCASRDEPGPIFMAEAMMFSKICICSENTGIAAFIIDGHNGFIYENNDAELLREKMMYVINNHGKLREMKKRSREIYDTYFSFEVFSENFLNEVDSLLEKGYQA